MHRSPYRAILIALILAVGSFAVAACGSSDNNTTSSSAGAASTSTAAKPAGKKIKVGLVTDIGGLNDRSFNALANKGLEDAKSSLGVEGRVLISKSNADYVPNLTTLAQQKYDLVIAVGFLMGDATEKVAGKFPGVKFAIIDSSAAGMKSRRPATSSATSLACTPRTTTSRRSAASAGRRSRRSTTTSRATRPAPRRPTRASRRSTPTPRTSTTRRSARSSRSTRSPRARRSSSRSPASAASASSTRPRRRASRASASTPIRPTSARRCSPAR